MATIKDSQARALVGSGWICCFMQLLLDFGLVFHIKGWTGGDLGVFLLFIGFPFGFGLAIALLLIRRWVVAILFLGLAMVTWHVVVQAANEVHVTEDPVVIYPDAISLPSK